MEKYLNDFEIEGQEKENSRSEKKRLAAFLDSLSEDEFMLTVPFERRIGDGSKK